MHNGWETYQPNEFFDEAITAKGNPRAASSQAINFLKRLSAAELAERRLAAELAIKEMVSLLPSTPRAQISTAHGPLILFPA